MLRNLLRILVLCVTPLALAQQPDTYQVIHAYPHDTQAFTQGLIYLDGHLYESAGEYGKSSLRMEDLDTGGLLKFDDVPAKYFAEGLTDWGNTLIQLTWREHLALVYDRATFRFLHTLPYTGEGWGLTHDDKSIIFSDGTPALRFLDPTTFHEQRRITVKDHGKPVTYLNELEYIHGQIYANIWHTDRIARIDPATGRVLGWIDLTGLLTAADRPSNPEGVLNGIAWDPVHDRLFVTGKLWPKLFEIKVIPAVVPTHRASQPAHLH
ncbi:MAG: glutaminyl-peptide cyclotransferase [Terracidiphilus sp.]|jgi:glutamine cyclotransferase